MTGVWTSAAIIADRRFVQSVHLTTEPQFCAVCAPAHRAAVLCRVQEHNAVAPQRQHGELVPERRAVLGIVEQPHGRAAPAIHGLPQRHGSI